jgi:hypothetical protein
MRGTLIQIAGAFFLLVFLWKAFRLAMDLRAARLFREEAREAREAAGERVVAEVPSASGELWLFAEDRDAFFWPPHRIPKTAVAGCRLLLNGGVIAAAARPGFELPPPPRPEEYEGRERWDVRIYTPGEEIEVACGTVREGVSREIARSVYDALAGVVS